MKSITLFIHRLLTQFPIETVDTVTHSVKSW